MKKALLSLVLFGALLAPQGAFAWEYNGISSLNPMPMLSYLNPLPYFGIGENRTNFSLNPFTGFKNCNKCQKVDTCNPCQVKRTACNECDHVIMPQNQCPSCKRAFNNTRCPSCNGNYYTYNRYNY